VTDAVATTPPPPNTVTLTIDGQSVTVPKGTNVLEAARTLGFDISAFCYHPGLPVVAQCRQCLVSVEKNPKLQPSCQQVCGDGMVVHTTDPQSTLARKQQLEFTLLNHPLDCPICDKAGECTLQKLYFEHDNADSRVDVPKVEKAKVVDLGPTIVLDQERCILCSRCIRTCDVVAGQHQLEFANRGDHEILTTAPSEALDNPYSLNTVDVCPVGALTAKDFRFTMRAWELEATPSVCNGCATGCNIEIHHKHDRAWRLVPRHNPDVNAYWMCDEGRFTYHDLREKRLGATVDGLPAGWEARPARAGSHRLHGHYPRDRDLPTLGVVLSTIVRTRPSRWRSRGARRCSSPARRSGTRRWPADGRGCHRTPGGPRRCAQADHPAYQRARRRAAVVMLGDVLPGSTGSAAPAIIAISAHERGPVAREGRVPRPRGPDRARSHTKGRTADAPCFRRRVGHCRPGKRSCDWRRPPT
jgi:NAD-dependent dihydropyrimidine dehydrogenase PreA subunit